MLRKDWRQRLDGRQVEGILLDTGCARTMVRKDLVSAGKIMMGDVVTIRCAHGDTVLYPLAAVELEVVVLRCQWNLLCLKIYQYHAVLLGRDVPQLAELVTYLEETRIKSQYQRR